MKAKLLVLASLMTLPLVSACGMLPPNPRSSDYSTVYVDSEKDIDAAIRIANLTTIFLNVGDEYSFNYYLSWDDGRELDITQYSFVSTNENVLRVENYTATATGEGYCYVNVSGPGLKKTYKQTIYVGSVAGNYVLDGKIGTSNVSMNLAEESFELNVQAGSYHKEDIAAYSGVGTWQRDAVCFLALEFNGQKPSEILSIENALAAFGLPEDLIESIETNFYGRLNYEEGVGITCDMYFHDSLIRLVNAK